METSEIEILCTLYRFFPGISQRHSSSKHPQWKTSSGRSPGLPTLRMEYLSPLRNSPHCSACPGWNRKIGPQFTSFSLHLGLHGFSLLHTCPLSPLLSVPGDLRRAVKSTHVSLTGSSIRAELRVTFTHLLRSDILASIAVSITTFYLTPGQRTSVPMISSKC
ncbi:hypothetical protein F2P79_019668 [Pimephales promelas]|nr:hypothetical protein F2P79_019668 [Pimephales promelas]